MRGGKRPGAGRKKGFAAKNAEEARKLFADMLTAEIQPIAQALIAKAKNGDVNAAKELFDRSWGKSLPFAATSERPARIETEPIQKGSLRLEYEEYCRANGLE